MVAGCAIDHPEPSARSTRLPPVRQRERNSARRAIGPSRSGGIARSKTALPGFARLRTLCDRSDTWHESSSNCPADQTPKMRRISAHKRGRWRTSRAAWPIGTQRIKARRRGLRATTRRLKTGNGRAGIARRFIFNGQRQCRLAAPAAHAPLLFLARGGSALAFGLARPVAARAFGGRRL